MARNWEGPGEFRDLIDLGGVIADRDLNQIGAFSWLIKPTLKLTPFITKLTGITQEMVDHKQPWSQVAPFFVKTIEKYRPFCCGRDYVVLRENCAWYSIPSPFEDDQFTDLRPTVMPLVQEFDPTLTSTGESHRAFGKTGLPMHRGMNDSINFLTALQELRKRGRI